MDNEIRYPKEAMLPNVDYEPLLDNIFGGNIVDLEFKVMNDFTKFTTQFTAILSDEKMVQTSELMVAHLCGYLGFFIASSMKPNECEQLYSYILNIIEKQSYYALKIFSKYPVNSEVPSKEIQQENFEYLRSTSPSSIIVQTIRLGRVILDAMQELKHNSTVMFRYMEKPKIEFFCPQDKFIALLKKSMDKTIDEWKNELDTYPLTYAINQITIQLAWLMGYLAHLDKSADTSNYQDYGLPCIKLYIEYGYKFLRVDKK